MIWNNASSWTGSLTPAAETLSSPAHVLDASFWPGATTIDGGAAAMDGGVRRPPASGLAARRSR